MKAAACVLLLLVALAAPGFAQAPDDKLIVPGQRIGKWTLEMTLGQFVQMHGSPPVVNANRGSDIAAENLWGHCWTPLGMCVSTFGRDGQRIEVIGSTFDDPRTDKGVHVGLTREEVEKAYGQPTGRATFQAPTPTITLVYDGLGIATHIRDGVVQRIMIFRPGAGQKIWRF